MAIIKLGSITTSEEDKEKFISMPLFKNGGVAHLPSDMERVSLGASSQDQTAERKPLENGCSAALLDGVVQVQIQGHQRNGIL